MRAILPTKDFAEMLASAKLCDNNIPMIFGTDGIKLVAVDPAHVMLVERFQPADRLDEYEPDLEDSTTIVADIGKIQSVLNAGGSDSTTMTFDRSGFKVKCGRIERRIPVAFDYTPPKIPRLSQDVNITIAISDVLSVVKVQDSIQDYVEIAVSPEGTNIQCNSTVGDELVYRDENLTSDEAQHVKVPLDYFINVLKTYKGDAVFSISTDYPITIRPQSDCPTSILIAPRIDTDGTE